MFKKKTDFEKAVAEQRRVIAEAARAVEVAQAVADEAREAYRALPPILSQIGKISRTELAALQVQHIDVARTYDTARAKLETARQQHVAACEALAGMERVEQQRQRAAEGHVAATAAIAATTAGLQSQLAAATEELRLAQQRVAELHERLHDNGDRLLESLSDAQRHPLVRRAEVSERSHMARSTYPAYNAAAYAMQVAQKKVDTLTAAIEQAQADAVKLAERYGKAETAVRGYAEEFRATAIASFKQALRNARNSAELTVANTRATIEMATSKTGSDAEALLTRNGVHIAELQRQIINQAVQDVITAISSELQE